MDGSTDQSGNPSSAGQELWWLKGRVWGPGAAAGLRGHQDPLGSGGSLSWARLSLAQLGSCGRAKGKETFPVIQLHIKLMYWCCAEAPAIEKNGKL